MHLGERVWNKSDIYGKGLIHCYCSFVSCVVFGHCMEMWLWVNMIFILCHCSCEKCREGVTAGGRREREQPREDPLRVGPPRQPRGPLRDFDPLWVGSCWNHMTFDQSLFRINLYTWAFCNVTWVVISNALEQLGTSIRCKKHFLLSGVAQSCIASYSGHLLNGNLCMFKLLTSAALDLAVRFTWPLSIASYMYMHHSLMNMLLELGACIPNNGFVRTPSADFVQLLQYPRKNPCFTSKNGLRVVTAG